MMSELKPCPFCGSYDSEMQQCHAEHYVQCLECESSSALFSSRRQAREMWNRRECRDVDWMSINSAPLDTLVMTKIDDSAGERNVQPMKMTKRSEDSRPLWWAGDMYVYYTPTHWKPM